MSLPVPDGFLRLIYIVDTTGLGFTLKMNGQGPLTKILGYNLFIFLKNNALLVFLVFYLNTKEWHFSGKKKEKKEKKAWIPLVFEWILIVLYVYTRGNGSNLLG